MLTRAPASFAALDCKALLAGSVVTSKRCIEELFSDPVRVACHAFQTNCLRSQAARTYKDIAHLASLYTQCVHWRTKAHNTHVGLFLIADRVEHLYLNPFGA